MCSMITKTVCIYSSSHLHCPTCAQLGKVGFSVLHFSVKVLDLQAGSCVTACDHAACLAMTLP